MKKEYWLAFISIGCWSTTALVSKWLVNTMNSMQVLMFSSGIASLALLVISLARGKLREIRSFRGRDWALIAALGLLGIFCNKLFFYLGVQRLDASQAFIINYLWPMLSVTFACLILKESFTLRKGLAVLLSFLGVIVVTTNGDFVSLSASSLIGALFCVGDAVAYGLFTVLDKKTTYDKTLGMLFYHLVTFLTSLGFCLFSGWPALPTGSEWLCLSWLGVMTSALAYTTWSLALRKGDTSRISNLAYLTPFVSLIWTTLVLHEPFRVLSLLGLLLIVAGVLLQMKEKKKDRSAEKA